MIPKFIKRFAGEALAPHKKDIFSTRISPLNPELNLLFNTDPGDSGIWTVTLMNGTAIQLYCPSHPYRAPSWSEMRMGKQVHINGGIISGHRSEVRMIERDSFNWFRYRKLIFHIISLYAEDIRKWSLRPDPGDYFPNLDPLLERKESLEDLPEGFIEGFILQYRKLGVFEGGHSRYQIRMDHKGELYEEWVSSKLLGELSSLAERKHPLRDRPVRRRIKRRE